MSVHLYSIQNQFYECTLGLNLKQVLYTCIQYKNRFYECTLVLNLKLVLSVSGSASASSTMTTRAPEEKRLTCATAPMVSS